MAKRYKIRYECIGLNETASHELGEHFTEEDYEKLLAGTYKDEDEIKAIAIDGTGFSWWVEEVIEDSE